MRDVNGPLWSLELELQFYVGSGLLVWLVDSKRFRLVAGAVLLIFLALCFRPHRDGALTLQPVSYAAFACGWLMQRWGDWVTASFVLPATLIAFVAWGVLLAVTPREELSHISGGWLISVAFRCYAMAAAGMVKPVGGRSVPRWAARAGGFSYTLYIIHFPLLLFLAFSLYNGAPEIMASSAIPVGFAAAFIAIATAAVVGFVVE